jgi:hypothetical protein
MQLPSQKAESISATRHPLRTSFTTGERKRERERATSLITHRDWLHACCNAHSEKGIENVQKSKIVYVGFYTYGFDCCLCLSVSCLIVLGMLMVRTY